MTQQDVIYSWSDIAEEFGESLLIGNGGSIAISRNFAYPSLYEWGVSNGVIKLCIQEIFNQFSKTRDFEKLLRKLWQADFINEKLDVAKTERTKVRKSYTDVRRALIDTVKDIHPNQDSIADDLLRIGQFCSRFSNVFTLNYDLTLMWATEGANKLTSEQKIFNDGFSFKKTQAHLNTMAYDDRADYGNIGVYYLHGSLCLCQTPAIGMEKKLVSEDVGSSLLKNLTDYWARNDAQPLFICEGNSIHKRSAIAQSRYLSAAYERLSSDRGNSLTIYGWSISDGDQHILDAIKHSPPYKRVAVSIYNGDKNYLSHAKQVLMSNGIESVQFFDSESPGCWANPSLP